MLPLHKRLQTKVPTIAIIQVLEKEGYVLWGNHKKHSFEIINSLGNKAGILHLPLAFGQVIDDMKGHDFQLSNPSHAQSALMVMMQAGEGAVGIIEQNELVEQKRIRKYMVRKGHGKAQIAHLNQKGKSKAGSRIRLKQTERFFEDINEQINAWWPDYEIDRIMLYCSPNMMPLWHGTLPELPFKANDERIYRINWYIDQPNLKELERSVGEMKKGYLSLFAEELAVVVEDLGLV